jgi:hypothetical protein
MAGKLQADSCGTSMMASLAPARKQRMDHVSSALVAMILGAESLSKAMLRPVLLTLLVACLVAATRAHAEPIPSGWQAHNFEAVGFTSKPGFKLAIHRQGDRWFLYAGTRRDGILIIDVTKPDAPVTVATLPSPANTLEVQVTVHDDLLITGMSRTFTTEEMKGPDPTLVVQPPPTASRPYSEGVRLWSLKDPARPVELSRWSTGGLGVHRNSYPGGKYAFLSAIAPGYRGLILIILDVSDRSAPKEAGRWWYPGQLAAERPSSVVPSFHGPAALIEGKQTLVLPYTPGVVTLDISDPAKPTLIGKIDMVPPIANTGTQSIHTAIPIDGGKLIYFNSEPKASGCNEGWQAAGLIDNSDPTSPQLLSIFPRPSPPPGSPYTDFCDKGGRFGPHNTNNEIHSPHVASNDKLIYLTYFNAGLRVFDISEPRQPTEAGWFMPPNPTRTARSQVGEVKVNQTQDVLVDTRGYAYVTDSASGIWIVRYTRGDKHNNATRK